MQNIIHQDYGFTVNIRGQAGWFYRGVQPNFGVIVTVKGNVKLTQVCLRFESVMQNFCDPVPPRFYADYDRLVGAGK